MDKLTYQSIKKLRDSIKFLIGYTENPKETLNEIIGIMNQDESTKPIDEQEARNLQTGLSSELTSNYAISYGKKLLVDSVVARAEYLNELTKFDTDAMEEYIKVLNNTIKSLDSYYNNGVVETRWMNINIAPMYQKYFIERLDREFVPTLSGINYKLNMVLDMKKLIIIYKEYLNKVLSKNYTSKLVEIDQKVSAMLKIIEDPSKVVVTDGKKVDEVSLPEWKASPVLNVPIYNQEGIGKLLRELAEQTTDIDNPNIDVLTGLEHVGKLLDQVYAKLGTEVANATSYLAGKYMASIRSITPRVVDSLKDISIEFSEARTTLDEYQAKSTNIVNYITKLREVSDHNKLVAYNVTSELATDLSNFIALYHMYYTIVMYSMEIKK